MDELVQRLVMDEPLIDAAPKRGQSFLEHVWGPVDRASLGCTTSLIFSALGAGLLSLPWAMAKLGLVVGMSVLFSSAVFSYATMEMLISSGLARDRFEYADTLADILGPPGATIVNVIVSLDSAGAICVFFKYMADSLRMLALSFGYDVPMTFMIIGISFGVVLPLSLPQRITALQQAATASIVPLAVIIGVVVLKCPSYASTARVEEMLFRPDVLSVDGAQACSTIFFSFMCHMNVWAIRNELPRPTPERTSSVFRRAMAALFLVYATVAVAGTISFGTTTPANVLQAYPTDDATNLVAHVLMSLMLVVCSVLCVHPVRHAMANLLGYKTAECCDNACPVTPMTPRGLAPLVAPGTSSNMYGMLPRSASASMLLEEHERQRAECAALLESEPTSPEPGEIVERREKTGSARKALKELTFFGSSLITFFVICGTCTVAVAVPSIVNLLGVLGGFFAVALMFVLPTFIYVRTKRWGIRAVAATAVTVMFSLIGLYASVGSVMGS